MRIVSRKALREFWEQADHHDAEARLRAWYKTAEKSDWATPADIKAQFRSASFLANNRVVFNIAGNKYRLIVWVNYRARVILVRFLGSHKEYDALPDPSSI